MKSPILIGSIAALSCTWVALAQDSEPVWEANAVTFDTLETGAGAYALIPNDAAEKAPSGAPIATTAGVICGEEAVLMIETGINERVYRQIDEAAQNKCTAPVVYAVNTSFHGDHSYGNRLLPDDAILIQHANTRGYLEQHFEQDVEFMLGLFHAGRCIEDAKFVRADLLIPAGGSLTLDLGGRKVDLIDFGFAQTGGDLFVWDSTSKTLWTGNALIAEAPSLPWLLDGEAQATLGTLRRVRDFLPDGATVIPGHGPAVGRDGFDWSIAYLEALMVIAETAVAKGQDLGAFRANADLPEYADYALYRWVHFDVNAPVAYKEASAAQ